MVSYVKHKGKKYFVKDESLRGVDGDMFNYSDIAQVLDDILSTNAPPYNVAVIGKWGLGKSSLINLVTERYRKDNEHYQIQEINAWKYEKESLRKVFLKQLWQGISNQRIHSLEAVKQEVANTIRAEFPKEQPPKDNRRTTKFLLTVGAIFLISVLAFTIYKIVQAVSAGIPVWTFEFFSHVFLRYCKNVSTVLIGPVLVALLKILIDDYHAKQSQKIELNFPIETTDDYEIFLETKIKERIREHPNLKIITVIDDLDRLSIDKIVEALDALKAFVGFERCIFIVPFDDEIIKCALDKRKMKEFKEQTEITDVIESELILDKLFQFKIYLPPILDFDIQQYAYKLAQQEVPDFISEYCPESTMKKVVERVLIHPGVTTPRQVKKLLNAFINNLMIVSARESSGKIQRGLLTSEDGIMQIAKISVLQADFNGFYDILFKDIRSIELILSAHKGEVTPENLPIQLQSYFEKIDGKLKIKSEHETLLNFLHRTAKYHVNSIAPYLYLAQDEISIKTGDELQRRAVSALRSRNPETLRDLLRESGDLIDVILYHLSRDYDELNDMLWVAMSIYNDIDPSRIIELAQRIIERVIELDGSNCEFLYSISPEVIFSIAEAGEHEEFNHQFKARYLSVLSNESWFNKEILINALSGVFENISALNNHAKEILNSICHFCVTNDTIPASALFDVVAPENTEFLEFWGTKWFDKLCTHIEKESDFSDSASEHLHATFNSLSQSYAVDTLLESMIPLAQYAAFLPIIDSIISQPYANDSDKRIKEMFTQQSATKLLESVIGHDFEKNGETICHIVDGLKYEVSEDNSEAVDEFTSNFVSSSALDSVLIYCGKQGFFEWLPETIKGISEAVFEDEDNDELLTEVAVHFTPSQIEALGKKLFVHSTFSNNKDYERELSIIRILSSIDGFDEELEDVADSKIIPQFTSNYQHENYREFTSTAIGFMKYKLSQTCIDRYVRAIVARYNNYRRFSLEAVNRVAMKMSAEVFKEFFEKVTTQSEVADFELAFEIIQNHNTLRPTDQSNLTNYISFLVKCLSIAKHPNDVLSTIRRSFSSISMLRELAVNAQDNPECSKEEISKTITYFVEQEDTIEDASAIFKMLCEEKITEDILHCALSMAKKYKSEDIYSQLIAELPSINSPQTMIGFVNVSIKDCNTLAACKLVLGCLQASFEKVDFVDCSISIMDKIKANEATFREHKTDLADVLRYGFISTTSDRIRNSILLMVSNFKIKPQFKKTLTGEDLEYYKKWTT